jgi:ABC-type glycerol-3-phosphate transport system permease component
MILLPQFFIVQRLIGLIPGTETAGFTRSAAQLVSLVMINLGGGALGTMMYTSAITAIPSDLEDAAYLDGAGRLQYLLRIVLPLLKVPIASMVVMALPWTWNMFLQPYIYLDPQNTTLIPLVQKFSGSYTTNFQVTFTAVFVSILPLAIVYIVFRRQFVQGVMAGAVKG